MADDEGHVPTADPRSRPKSDQSERILQDAFLTGGRDMSGAGKLSAGVLSNALNDDEPRALARDSSWASHAEDEGGPADGGIKGVVRRVRHYFSI